MKEQARAE
jgi:hypothetical protein